MPVCPFCQTARANPLDRCPKCGRRGSELPPPLIADAPAVRGQHIYELDAAAMAEAPARRDAVAPGAPRPDSGAVGAPALDSGAFGAAGAGPEIELDIKPSPSGVPPPVTGRGSFAPAAVASAIPVIRSQAPPPVDPLEARLAGKFGPSPEHWWETIGYARRTRARLRELEGEVERRRERNERSRRALEDALVAIAVRGIAVAATLPKHLRAPYVATIDRIKAAEATLRKLDAAAAAEMDTHSQKVAALDARLTEFEQHLAQAQQEERDAARLVPSPARDERTSRIKLRLEEVRHKIAVAREERTALASWQPVARSAAAEQARTEYRATCADFGRFVVDDTANFGPEFDAARKETVRLGTARELPKKELAVYEAALSTYDQKAVEQGQKLMILAVVVGVVLAGLVAFLATR
jgi:hypothetical protein